MLASSPEELETLLEDCLLLEDAEAVADLFVPHGVLIAAGSVLGRIPATTYLLRQRFVATTRCVTVVGRVGIVVGRATINVSVRGDDDAWRLVAAVHSPATERATTGRLPQQPGAPRRATG